MIEWKIKEFRKGQGHIGLVVKETQEDRREYGLKQNSCKADANDDYRLSVIK